jgi:hypothetical protein
MLRLKAAWSKFEILISPTPLAGFCTNLASIIAIHGLGGDAYGTWAHDNGKLWLRDFLPSQIPEARILTYGYDSEVAFSKSSAEVDDFARDLLQRLKSVRKSAEERARPLFFICHSLGGILFKQARQPIMDMFF